MRVCGLIATQDFNTQDATGIVRGVKHEPLPPLMFSTAQRLIKSGYAVRRRTKAIFEDGKNKEQK